MNNNIHPVLYAFFLILKDELGAEIVHRRKRHSDMCIEIIFYSDDLLVTTGRLNSLPEAEECGYWVICRRQTKRGHTIYKGHSVFQLFLSPVHPKKRRESIRFITPRAASTPVSAAITA